MRPMLNDPMGPQDISVGVGSDEVYRLQSHDSKDTPIVVRIGGAIVYERFRKDDATPILTPSHVLHERIACITPGRHFVHYKGGHYTVVMLAHHHETRELLVIYASHEKESMNVRPAAEFVQDVEIHGKIIARFLPTGVHVEREGDVHELWSTRAPVGARNETAADVAANRAVDAVNAITDGRPEWVQQRVYRAVEESADAALGVIADKDEDAAR